MNAKAQSAYASAQQLCAAGTPTNAVVAGLDIVTIMNSAVLQPYLAKIKIH
jgi:maleate cis-trans isomerase